MSPCIVLHVLSHSTKLLLRCKIHQVKILIVCLMKGLEPHSLPLVLSEWQPDMKV